MENPVNNALKENLNASAEHPISTSNRREIQQTTIRVKNQFLLLLLSGVKEDKPKDIAVQLGISKQDLNYHLQKLIKLNILFREQSYPFAIYRLTDLGERVKESLIQSEHPKSLWRVHNLIIGFRILNLGSFNFVETTRRKLIRMRNWSYAREEMDGYVINVQDTGLLKIYVPAKYTKDPDLAIGEMISEADRIAADYINRYDMKLQRLEIVRKAEKELQNSEVLTKIFGRIKTEGIYVNESDGFAALEEKQDSYVIEDLLKLPEKVDGLEKHLIKQTQIMDQFSKNIELHLAVLTELRDAIKILGGDKNGESRVID